MKRASPFRGSLLNKIVAGCCTHKIYTFYKFEAVQIPLPLLKKAKRQHKY